MGKKTINSLRKSSKKTSEDFIVNEEAKVDQPNEEAVANHEESQEKLGAQIEEEKSENTKRKRVRKRKASNIEGNQAIENDEQDSKVTTIQSNDESR
jgi:NADH:ubiquinone oxidoreductase subunit D